jgi:hypothetical protein
MAVHDTADVSPEIVEARTLRDEASVRAAWEEIERNVEWADAHADELDKLAGHWVCVADQRIVAAEIDAARFEARLRAEPHSQEGRYIFYVPRPGELSGIHPTLHVG